MPVITQVDELLFSVSTIFYFKYAEYVSWELF